MKFCSFCNIPCSNHRFGPAYHPALYFFWQAGHINDDVLPVFIETIGSLQTGHGWISLYPTDNPFPFIPDIHDPRAGETFLKLIGRNVGALFLQQYNSLYDLSAQAVPHLSCEFGDFGQFSHFHFKKFQKVDQFCCLPERRAGDCQANKTVFLPPY